ncbi:PIR Superfamily Protein [Plasmodium ovale wallikeri]|uniref:PIR Superfamily Protein n=1 Tax=Plasmodium ovale wallikeri TaxID=864142 RepID=A0A1A9AMI3_PLAOA|nr:PIR Superfamily Protein [Plasmodium ovale wallikeri]
MGETIYSVVRSFSQYKSIIDRLTNDDITPNRGQCANLFNGSLNEYKDLLSSDKCEKGMKFLSFLKENVHSYKIADGCQYIYHWLYTDVLSKNESTHNIFTFYNNLMEAYDEYDVDTCKNHIEHIKKIIISKLDKLMELYKYFNQISSQIESCSCAKKCATLYNDYLKICHEENDQDFCNELENFKTSYENRVISLVCDDSLPKTLPSVRGNSFIVALTSCIVILSISFISFMLYKFTYLGSMLHARIIKKKIWNYIDKEPHEILYNSNMSNISSENSLYNISYNSTEYS